MKPCTRCDSWLPASSYYADKSKSNGLTSDCKDCRKQSNREAKHRAIAARGLVRLRDRRGRFVWKRAA